MPAARRPGLRPWCGPTPTELVHVVSYAHGRIVIAAEPDDEIAEAWRETRTTMAVLFVMCAGAIVLVFLFLGRALQPLSEVARALEGIERGQFATRVPAIGLADIDAITARYNHMAAALADSHAENVLLAQRSLDIQEQERRHLAHELHDEMGQSITAIKALAVSIRERLEAAEPALAERAATITDVSSDIYARVRRMMARLHPVVLDELGLVAAIESMVDDWNGHHADCFCRFSAPRELPALHARRAYRPVSHRAGSADQHRAPRRRERGGASNCAWRHAADGAASCWNSAVRTMVAALRRAAASWPRPARHQGARGSLGGQIELDARRGRGPALACVRLPLAMLLETENERG